MGQNFSFHVNRKYFLKNAIFGTVVGDYNNTMKKNF